MAYLDTHAAVFLHDGLVEEFSKEAKRQIEANDLLISPMVYLEFEYLYERRKIGVAAVELAATLNAYFGVEICRLPFSAVVAESLPIKWTSDPFDRLIVAQASANKSAKLITRDRLIRKKYAQAVW